jgi:hypothetical protein
MEDAVKSLHHMLSVLGSKFPRPGQASSACATICASVQTRKLLGRQAAPAHPREALDCPLKNEY